MPNEFLTR